MTRRPRLLPLLLALLLCAFGLPPGSQSNAAAQALPLDYVPNEVVVMLSNPASRAQRDDLKPFGRVTENSDELADLGVVILKVPEGTVMDVIAELQEQPGVVYAEPNYYAYALDVYPNDPGWSEQYGPRAIRAPQGWVMATGSPAVTIAILDTGVYAGHPDLGAKLVAGYDFVNGDADPADDHGHGTRAAGIAAALSNNGEGIAGISWGARIMPVKVLGASASGTYANVAAGIRFAVDNGARVINLSLGGPSGSQTLLNAVTYGVAQGAVLVASAGNSGGALFYPAAYPDVIAVGATDQNNQRSASSSRGPQLDLAAPGVGIYTTQLGGGYTYESGTSAAAPFVSGAAAILIGIPGNGFSAVVEEQLKLGARDLGAPGFDEDYGWGLLQLDGALRAAGLTPPPTATPRSTRTHTPDPLSATPSPGWVYGGPGVIHTLTPAGGSRSTATLVPAGAVSSTSSPTSTALFEDSAEPGVVGELLATRINLTPSPSPAAFFPLAALPAPSNPFALPIPCLGAAFLLAGFALLFFVWRRRKLQ